MTGCDVMSRAGAMAAVSKVVIPTTATSWHSHDITSGVAAAMKNITFIPPILVKIRASPIYEYFHCGATEAQFAKI